MGPDKSGCNDKGQGLEVKRLEYTVEAARGPCSGEKWVTSEKRVGFI